jgi:hypothetical protein
VRLARNSELVGVLFRRTRRLPTRSRFRKLGSELLHPFRHSGIIFCSGHSEILGYCNAVCHHQMMLFI